MHDLLADSFFNLEGINSPTATSKLVIAAAPKPSAMALKASVEAFGGSAPTDPLTGDDLIYQDHQDQDSEKAPMANLGSANVLFPEGYTMGEVPKFSSEFALTASRMDEAAQALFLADRAENSGLISQESITHANALVSGVISNSTPIGMFTKEPSGVGVQEAVTSITAQVDKRLDDVKETTRALAEAFLASAKPVVASANKKLIAAALQVNNQIAALMKAQGTTGLADISGKVGSTDWQEYLKALAFHGPEGDLLTGVVKTAYACPVQLINLNQLSKGHSHYLAMSGNMLQCLSANNDTTISLTALGDDTARCASITVGDLIRIVVGRVGLDWASNVMNQMRSVQNQAQDILNGLGEFKETNISDLRDLLRQCTDIQSSMQVFQSGSAALTGYYQVLTAVGETLSKLSQK